MIQKEQSQNKTNNNKFLLKEDFINVKIHKEQNCFFRAISVYFTDTQENHEIIREIISDYAMENKEEFIELFIQDNIEQVLGSIELNDYLDKMKNNGEYASIIELSIAAKIFSINIHIYLEENNNPNNYILYEKIDKDVNHYLNATYYLKMEIIFQYS